VLGSVLRVLTAVFYVVAPICVAVIAASSFTGIDGSWLTWTIGGSLLAVMLCSGGIAWIEFNKNPLGDTERGEWTNRMLFYALVFTVTLFVTFLYLPTLIFA
jgi:Na+/H+-translocating membrane pyrophosphatase